MDRTSLIIPSRWDQEEIDKRTNYKCIHHHNGISHKNCYDKENGYQERKVFLDIETGGLDAAFDIVYCFVLRSISDPEVYYTEAITENDRKNGLADKRVLGNLCDALWHYDRIVTHYGSNWRFDIPFVRTRCIRLGLDFPKQGMLYVSDTYPMAKKLLKIASYRQNSIARAILGYDDKTIIDSEHWRNTKYGTRKQRVEAIKYIIDHCVQDTLQGTQNYLKLLPFCKEGRTSI